MNSGRLLACAADGTAEHSRTCTEEKERTVRILVADDDDSLRETVVTLLEAWGHDVIEACDGEEAKEVLQDHDPPRLAILDWNMPECEGPDVCRWLRERMTQEYTYVILLTAKSQREDLLEGLEAGADEYLTKPFDRAELDARIRIARRLLSLETRDLALFALAKLAESRDPETGDHLERVRTYCRELAKRLAKTPECGEAIDGSFVRLIYVTSPLHDIGKVAIPDNVLLKPGRLTKKEFEVMKTHSLRGAETLDAAIAKYPNAQFLTMARDIALAHHERFDGSGYPNGLAGEDIPLSARIVAVADVYDAVTSKRVYKKAETHENARDIIIEGSDSHFDPLIVDAFSELQETFEAIMAGRDPAPVSA